MANQISVLLNHVISIFDAMPLVNTIAFQDEDTIDNAKENIYPLVTIQMLSSPAPLSDLREYRLSFEVLNQRDDRKVAASSKLATDTNYIDNMNICDTIANDFVMEVIKTHNNFDITIVDGSLSEFEPIKKDERNGLDGFRFDAVFSLHQNNI